MNHYKRYSCVGPGGKKCSCCYPPPGKFRRFMERVWKRRERAEEKKILFKELSQE